MKEVEAIITQERARISCNFEQVKSAIQDTLAEYKGAIFTEDSKTYAKKHVASLRAQKKNLQDNLRNEKKKYMEPWEEVEKQAKSLIDLYDEPINLINGQIQGLEEKRLAEKRELISSIYQELISDDLKEMIPLDRIYNPKWENATFREKGIREELLDIAEKTDRDIHTIAEMKSDVNEKALAVYREKYDLSEAIAYIHHYEQQKQEILIQEQERKRREEEERIRREEREKLLVEQRAREEKEAAIRKAEQEKQEALLRAEEEKTAAIEQAKEETAQEVIESFIPNSNDDTELYEYRISLSADAKEKLEMYMDSVGIEWEMM